MRCPLPLRLALATCIATPLNPHTDPAMAPSAAPRPLPRTQIVATPSYISASDLLNNGGAFVYLTNYGLIDALDVRMTFPGSASSPISFVPGLPDCTDPAFFCPTVLQPASVEGGTILGPQLDKIPANATVKLPVQASAASQSLARRRLLQSDGDSGCFTVVIATVFFYPW